MSLIIIVSLTVTSVFAQKSQVGYVRTVQKSGRPAQYLAGAHITTLESVNEATSQVGGYFEIPVKSANGKNGYTITDVSLFGYNLIDEGKLNKRQTYSLSPIEIVLISKEEENRQRQFLENKIRAVIKENYETKLEELQDQYDAIMQLNLQYADQLNNLDALVTKIVYLDYKNINDSLDIQIAEAYEQGDFLRACELIDQKPSFSDRLSAYKSKKEAIRKLSESAEIEKETVIRECDIKIAYYKSKWQYDSVLYFVDIKLELEPENGEFLLEKAHFLWAHFTMDSINYDSPKWVLQLYDEDSALQCAKQAFNILLADNNPKIIECCQEIGRNGTVGLDERIFYLKKGYDFLRNSAVITHYDSLRCMNFCGNIGNGYLNHRQYDSAIKYGLLALEYSQSPDDTISNYGFLSKAYKEWGAYKDAIVNCNKAEKCFYNHVYDTIKVVVVYPDTQKISHKESLEDYLQDIYFEKASLFVLLGQYDDALSYINALKNLDVVLLLDETEIELLLADIYYGLGQYNRTLKYCNKHSKEIKRWITSDEERTAYIKDKSWNSWKEWQYWDDRKNMNRILNRIAAVYERQGKYEKALQTYKEAMTYHIGEYTDYQPETYFGMAKVYVFLNDLETALMYYEKALQLYDSVLPEEHPKVLAVKQAIKECKKAMKKKKQ